MAAKQKSAIVNFLQRNGLSQNDYTECYKFIQRVFQGRTISMAECQGYCSLTFFVADDTIVQFRPRTYKLNLLITHAAREIYGPFAPRTTCIAEFSNSGLLVYQMNRLQGVAYKDFRSSNALLVSSTEARAVLCRDFARFMAMGWHGRTSNNRLLLGIVGPSLESRLELLSRSLPPRFQPTATRIRQNLHKITCLPWVLTHGDIVPSNIIINPTTHQLIGLVDWAEGELLPFGICLYGVEEILGELSSDGFKYHADSQYLREIFWTELIDRIPNLAQHKVLEGVRLARDLGILLWHGIAFDDGAINRVVEEGRDRDEIYRLDAFLDTNIEIASSSVMLESSSKL